MKQILFVRNNQILEEVAGKIDKSSVAAIYNLDFFEKIPGNNLPDELPINGLDRFKDDSGGGVYHALIIVNKGAPKDSTQFGGSYFYRLSLAIARTLKRNGISFSFWPDKSSYSHIHGVFPNVIFDLGNDTRDKLTAGLIIETFRTFPQDFAGKKIDMWIAVHDFCANDALDLAYALDLPHVFAYYTSYAMKDRVIAFPDFNCCYNEKKFFDPINATSKCLEAASKPWQDSHLFWRGSLFVSFSRQCLFELGKKYPQYLKIEDFQKDGKLIPMTEQAKYKYLIDTRGNAWSGRLQTLLKLGRVVFVADRPYREWFFDKMIPMKHFVPVEEDMSDLIEKICYMERHPEIYEKIVSNLREFVEENLTPRRILFETKELILRYGVVE